MNNDFLPKDLNGVHVHFVGIKGTGMTALVEIFFHNGAIITGSDVSERFYTDEILEKLGLKAQEFSSKNITDDIQYVIYSAAYKLDSNPDLIQATKKGIPCLLYTQALGQYSERSYSCGICGVHGKTSTTGLTGTMLKELDLPVQILAGSVIKSFGDSCTYSNLTENSQDNRIFVAETCEYKRHFMSFCPQKIILTSVESDHQDFFPTYQDIRQAFIDYICKLPQKGQVIYCCDDEGAVDTVNISKNQRPDIEFIPYGTSASGDYKVVINEVQNEEQLFTIGDFGQMALKVPGHHEVLDAVAGFALCVELLKSFGKNPRDYIAKIAKGINNFAGGKRRSEIIGEFTTKSKNNVLVIDDYGHHPTAVKTTLEGFRSFYKKRKIIVDFMSHTYSRTQSLLEEFASCFGSADVVVLNKIYASARENIADFNITGKTLFQKACNYHNNVVYCEEFDSAINFLKDELEKTLPAEYSDGYLFVSMGAGDNWKIGKELISYFNK